MKKKNYKVKLKVKELLEERNITQKKLAQISGIRESTISDIVRGTRTVINFEHLSKIAEALIIFRSLLILRKYNYRGVELRFPKLKRQNATFF